MFPVDTSWYGDQPSTCYICKKDTRAIAGCCEILPNGRVRWHDIVVVKCIGCGMQYKKVS